MPVSPKDIATSQDLLSFVASSPSMFHAVFNMASRLSAAGATELLEADAWGIVPGNTYYVTRNDSSIIAFRVGADAAPNNLSFQMIASHSDSPTYKVKAVPELAGPGEYLRLNVEGYGGMINSTWLDRPLSLAGRVLVRNGNTIESRLFAPDRDLLLIPSVAIHLNHKANEGVSLNRQVDLCPLFSTGELQAGDFDRLVAMELGVEPSQVLGKDLYLVNRERGCIWGWESEFVSSAKLDDLQCACASLEAFVAAGEDAQPNSAAVQVFACFDNEEVGSNTKQGAISTFLPDVLGRVVSALGGTREQLLRAQARSFMVSADNAHAVHPNHAELHDETNRAWLNGGVVIKEAASQQYTTDALSRAIFMTICNDAGIPTQVFANRSDSAGGSTLGNLSNVQFSVHAVDVGLPQLAMHSSYETAGVCDTAYAIAAFLAFYTTPLQIEGARCAVVG